MPILHQRHPGAIRSLVPSTTIHIPKESRRAPEHTANHIHRPGDVAWFKVASGTSLDAPLVQAKSPRIHALACADHAVAFLRTLRLNVPAGASFRTEEIRSDHRSNLRCLECLMLERGRRSQTGVGRGVVDNRCCPKQSAGMGLAQIIEELPKLTSADRMEVRRKQPCSQPA